MALASRPPASAPPGRDTGPLMTAADPPDAAEMARIARIAHEAAGIVILEAKTGMVQSRLAKRLRALGLRSYAAYLALVESPEGAEERTRMISALTTNVSHFFRERHHFDLVRDRLLPELVPRARAGGRVRFWSAGCSNGQEAYSLAITLLEQMPEAPELDVRILASDIDPAVLARGQSASYDPPMIEGVDPLLRKRYFETVPEGARLVQAARSLVQFRQLNLHGPWPMQGRFDAIFCRNVVIYFDADAQARLWTRFRGALAPRGWLFVGHSERVPVGPGSGFETAGITAYRRLD